MSDPLERAQRYRDRAEECLRLSEIAEAAEIKAQYRRIAQHYLTLAKAEENLIGEPNVEVSRVSSG
jgi:hypothetical protein